MDALLTGSTSSSASSATGGAGVEPTFREYKQRIYRTYQHARHIDLIDQYLGEVLRYVETEGREGIGRLLITLPPRHSKSFNVSRMFPAYVVGKHPDWRVMLASYAANLAQRFSRQARNLLLLKEYQAMFPGVTLSQDSHAVNSWAIAGYEGGMDAYGVGGGVTGNGGHILIADDLISGRANAESAVMRQHAWEWFTDDFSTRIDVAYAAQIVTHTRWHEDDPIGRIRKRFPGKWVELNLPAIAEENDPMGREPGEALWAEKFPLKTLEDLRATLGAYSWASEYQQHPTPREGGLFKWQQIDDARKTEKPVLKRIVVAIDPAVTATANSDETGIVVAGIGIDGHGYVLEDVSLSASPDTWARQAVSAYRKWSADRLIAEVNNGGDMVELTIRTADKTVPITQVRASRGKVTRAEPIAALYEQGKVHHVGYHTILEDQMCSVIDGSNSPDRVDALVWALSNLMLKPDRFFVA